MANEVQVNEKKAIIPPKSPTPKPPIPTPPKVTVSDRNLIESLLYMKQNSLMKESQANPKFETVREAEDYAKEEIIFAIKDSITNLKEDISELQKKGYELHLEGISLLEIPLKIRVWMSNPLKKDLEGIYGILNKVSPKIATLKKEQEAKEVEKEKQEKVKEQQERLVEQQKEKPLKPKK